MMPPLGAPAPRRAGATVAFAPAALLAVALAAAAFGVAGCAVTPPAGERAPVARAAAAESAEALARAGDAAGSAQAWERVARGAGGAARARAWEAAVRQWLVAGRAADAERVLAEWGAALPAADPARTLLAAEAALAAGRPGAALETLRALGEPVPAGVLPAATSLRARALVASGRVAEGLRAQAERERLAAPGADAERDADRLRFWTALRDSGRRGADLRTPRGADRDTAGWLELARLALGAARNPAALRPQVEAWRSRYAAHPAAGAVVDRMQFEPRSPATAVPGRVALLLPLTGRMEPAGTALRDGFLAAWFQDVPAARPELQVYDSGADAAAAYRRAVADGAGVVVGPLAKEDVQAVARVADPAVVTLALNALPDGEPAPRRFFQYALAPEDEARQVAERLAAQGLRTGIALVPTGEWGARVLAAFDAAVRERGGAVVASRAFLPNTADFSDVIVAALGFTDSQRRHRQLVATLGTPLEFAPRRRDDLQFVFVAGQPVQGRLIRPQLKFHYAGDLPVYSLSDVYEPNPGPNADLDGVTFPDMPWSLAQDPATVGLRESLARAWPQGVRRRGRLYAMGYDAHRLALELAGGAVPSASAPIPGLTGRLSVDPEGRVQRGLDWAVIGTDGMPQPAYLPPSGFAPGLPGAEPSVP